MRKIRYSVIVDEKTYQPRVQVALKDEQGVVTILSTSAIEVSKYSAEENAIINYCNKTLKAQNLPEMTEEEIEWMLDPTGLARLDKKVNEPEDIQQLAGFKVEKKIINV